MAEADFLISMIIFIIPTYNEEKNILSLLVKLSGYLSERKWPYKILIINDGSTDQTLQVVASLKNNISIEVFSHYPNKGIGETFRLGFQEAVRVANDQDIIVTLEADNTSDLIILNKLLDKIQEGCDVALASCYAPGGGVQGTTLFRKILSLGANTLLKLFIPLKGIHTYSSFYRAYRAKAIKDLYYRYRSHFIQEDGFECMVELLIKCAFHGLKIDEVPMMLDGKQRRGKSKMKILKTLFGFLRVILKYGILNKRIEN